jgi:cystathionine beta-lyase/cystathionine gamma-synthase
MEEGFNTRAVRAGEFQDSRVGNVNTPIFETSTFFNPNRDPEPVLDHTRDKPYMYTRWGNPTLESLERKYASLDSVEEGLSFSTGMAAISSVAMAFLKKGDKLLSIRELYGETFVLFTRILPSMGINVDFVTLDEMNSGGKNLSGYKAIYLESIVNPTLGVSDIQLLGKIAAEENIPLLVDSTFASPFNQNPSSFGAAVTIHSGTKYIGGHSDILLGLAGFRKELMGSIWQMRKVFGGVPDPIQAFLGIRGLKTLGIRMKVHNDNAMKIAKFLSEQKSVNKVFYPGLPDSPYHEIANRNLRGFGGMVSFEIKGGLEEARNRLKKLRLCSYAPSLGGVETLITLPVETTHLSLTPQERKEMGIEGGLVRLSVGIEDSEDIIEDLKAGLE